MEFQNWDNFSLASPLKVTEGRFGSVAQRLELIEQVLVNKKKEIIMTTIAIGGLAIAAIVCLSVIMTIQEV